MQPSDVRILRDAAIPTGVLGALATVAALPFAGVEGALATVFATVIVVAFFSISAFAVNWAAKISAQTMMYAAMLSYVGKILVLMIVMSSVKNVTAFDTKIFGFTVVGLALAWIAAEFRIGLNQRSVPFMDEPQASKDAPAETKSS